MVGDKLVRVMRETAKIPMTTATEMLFGEVTSTQPLKIKVDNRFELTEIFLVLTSLVSDFNVTQVVNGNAETVKLQMSLKKGERVILLRVQGGQKYIVIDRIR